MRFGRRAVEGVGCFAAAARRLSDSGRGRGRVTTGFGTDRGADHREARPWGNGGMRDPVLLPPSEYAQSIHDMRRPVPGHWDIPSWQVPAAGLPDVEFGRGSGTGVVGDRTGDSQGARGRRFAESQWAGIAAAISLAEATAATRGPSARTIPRQGNGSHSSHDDSLFPILREEIVDERFSPGWARDRRGGLGDSDGRLRRRSARPVAPREVAPGALRDRYEIPEVRFRRNQARGLFL
jgi:hypothetical protein